MKTLTRSQINEIKRNNELVEKIRKEDVGYMVYWSDKKSTFFESVNSLLYFFENREIVC